jgi:DNA topoisomerase-2
MLNFEFNWLLNYTYSLFKAKDLVEELRRRNYDPDPVRVWKKQQAKSSGVEEEAEQEEDDDGATGPAKVGDYDYLLDMPMRSLTYEKKEELLRKRDAKMAEYQVLCGKTPSDLWREDLNCFLVQLQETEDAEIEEPKKITSKLPMANKGRKKQLAPEVMPSPKGLFTFMS